MSVELPEVAIEAGARLAVTPEGWPVADKATEPVNPFSAATLTLKVVEFPTTTDREPGVAERLKSGGWVAAFTVTLTVVLWTRLPLVPVRVMTYVPADAELFVETFRVQLPDPVIAAGLQFAAMPAGIPLSARVTVPANPLLPATLNVNAAEPPIVIVWEAGKTESEKSGEPVFDVNVTPTVLLWLRVPLAPATVKVYVPATAVLLVDTLSVAVPEVLIDAGLKLACIPTGNPLTVRDTKPENPSIAETVTLKLALWPIPIVWALGLVDSEKSGIAIALETVRLNVVLRVRVPLTPDRVSVYVPGVADLDVTIERVGLPDPFTLLELRLAVTPEGTPNNDS